MRFKKGDRVQMAWKRAKGFPKTRTTKGVVVATDMYSYGTPKMLVRLDSGDHVIQDIEYDRDAWAVFRKFTGP